MDLTNHEELLDQHLSDLSDSLNNEYRPHTENIQRKIVKFRKALIDVKVYAELIKDHTGVDIKPHAREYLEM